MTGDTDNTRHMICQFINKDQLVRLVTVVHCASHCGVAHIKTSHFVPPVTFWKKLQDDVYSFSNLFPPASLPVS